MGDRWSDLFDEPARTDKGPEARRAAAGLPPGPRTDDPSPSGPQYTTVRTASGESTPGRLPLPAPAPDGQANTVPDPTKYRTGEGTRAQTELEGDPMLQDMTAAAITAPLAAPVIKAAGAVGGAIGRAAGTVAAGGAQGAAGAAMTGGDTRRGAAMGAAFSLGPALEGIGAAMSQGGPIDAGVVQDLSRYAKPEELQNMRHIGYSKVAETARKFGVVGAKDSFSALEGVKAGKSAVGSEIGDVYSTIGSEYAPNLGGIMQRADQVQKGLRGTRAGNEIADAVHDEMQRLWDAHGGSAQSKITLQTLRREVTDSQNEGYGGARYEKLSDSQKATVQREVAGVLQGELEAGLAQASKDPRFGSQVARLKDLNGTYRALLTLEDTTGRMVDRTMKVQEPTLRQRFSINRPAATQPVQPPSGRRLGTIGQRGGGPTSDAAFALAPGLAGALSKPQRDPMAVSAEVRAALLGAGGVQ